MKESDRKKLESKLSIDDRITFDYFYKAEIYKYRTLGTVTYNCKEHQSTLIILEDRSWNCEDCIRKMTTEQRSELYARVASNVRCFDDFLIKRSKVSYKIKAKIVAWMTAQKYSAPQN